MDELNRFDYDETGAPKSKYEKAREALEFLKGHPYWLFDWLNDGIMADEENTMDLIMTVAEFAGEEFENWRRS